MRAPAQRRVAATASKTAAVFCRRIRDAVDPAIVDLAEQTLIAIPGVLDVGHVIIRSIDHQLRTECEIVIRTDASAVEKLTR